MLSAVERTRSLPERGFPAGREGRHEFLTVEHLLLSILDVAAVREILQGLRRRHAACAGS
jgi:hypothetical protein